MWIFIVIALIVVILVAVVKNNKKQIQIEILQKGGFRKLYPIFTERLEQIMEMSCVNDTGNSFTYKKTYEEKGTLTLGLKLNAGRETIVFSNFATINGEEYNGIDIAYNDNDKLVDQCIMSSINNFIDKGFLSPIGSVDIKENEQNEKQKLLENFIRNTIVNSEVENKHLKSSFDILGEALRKKNEVDELDSHLEKIKMYTSNIEKNLNVCKNLNGRGIEYMCINENQKALLDFERVLLIAPNNIEAKEYIEFVRESIEMSLLIDGFEQNEKFEAISSDTKGLSIDLTKCDFIDEFYNDLAIVSMNGKYGFIDKYNRIEIPIIFDIAEPFIEELALVRLNDKVGYVNKYGDIEIPLIYDFGNSFKNGITKVVLHGKEGYIDVGGNWIKDSDGSTVPIKTRSLEVFSEEIGVDKLSVYRNKKDILYVAVKDMPSKFVAHVSKSITCKGDLHNHVITTFLDKNGEEYNVLHNLKPSIKK